MMDIYIVIAASAIILTAVIAYLLHKATIGKINATAAEHIRQQQMTIQQFMRDKEQLQTQCNDLLARSSKAESNNEILQQHYHAYLELREEFQAAQLSIANLSANLKMAREKLDNQQNDFLRMREQFKLEFSQLSQQVLNDQSIRFAKANEEKIKQLLDPLKVNLTEFRQKVEETYDRESKERFSLGKEVHRLIEMTQSVSQEANNLATALKGNNKLQGNWGEMILESLLQNSGLTKGREYFVQEYIRDNSGNIIKDIHGKALQPDVIIHYPDQRRIIIDSKVSMVAWEQCVSCNEKMQQQTWLKEHIRSIRQHVEGLSKKDYANYAQALDYVILFIPIEPAFLEAVKTDTQLWKYAYDKRILLVSPTNLFSVLKIIADLWKVEMQNKHAVEIAEKAGALYDKVYGFIDNMEQVGKKISDAHEHYNKAFNQLATGRGNIITRIEELKKMGAKATKQIAEKHLEENRLVE